MTSSTSVSTSRVRLAAVLGLLTAVGPFAIDMYLPALPSMGASLAASPDALQGSLMAFYLALGFGQLVAGPLSDAFGRKRPLYVGLTLYVLASIGCAFAGSIPVLIALRLLQGLGACVSTVTPRAVVRDLHTGPEAAKLMTLLMTIYTVSPILAPLAGSFIAAAAGWRGVFWALAIAGGAGLVMVATLLPETRAPQQRTRAGLARAWAGYATLVRDRRFAVPALMASLTLASFFIYVAGSSFVMSSHYGVSPRNYALLFALNAIPYVVVAQFNGWLARRFAMRSIARVAVAGQFAVAALLCALVAGGADGLVLLQAGTMLLFSFSGVILPTMFVVAMEEHAALAGSASALIGSLNFAGGAVAMAIVAPFSDGSPRPMLAGIVVCAAAVFGLGFLLRHRAPAAAARPASP